MWTWVFGALAIVAGILLARMIYERKENKKKLEAALTLTQGKVGSSAVAVPPGQLPAAPYHMGPAVDPMPCVVTAPLRGVDCGPAGGYIGGAYVPSRVDLFPGSYATYGMYNTSCYGTACSSRKPGFLIASWLLYQNIQLGQQTRQDLEQCRSTTQFYKTVGFPTPTSVGEMAVNAQNDGQGKVTVTYELDPQQVQAALKTNGSTTGSSPLPSMESLQGTMGGLKTLFQMFQQK